MYIKKKIFTLLCIIFLAFLISLLLEIALIILTINKSSSLRTTNDLQSVTKRVQQDIRYVNGRWDTSLYNADVAIPVANPLYVITTDGFLIERWKPIHGFLDTAEFDRLLVYDKPETITTIANENWRLVSQPIKNSKRVLGVITVSVYNPDPTNLPETDQQLNTALKQISSKLIVKGDSIDPSKVDPRQLPYDITYQIVDRFNNLLAHNDNTSSVSHSPSFIDSSYVYNQLKSPPQEVITDTQTKQKYLVMTTPIYDASHNIVGIIVTGDPINRLYSNLLPDIPFIIIFTILQFLILLFFLYFFIKNYTFSLIEDLKTKKMHRLPEKISFNKKDSILVIEDTKIAIPFASYQYYFCKALFSKPQKRWEADELLEIFGEEVNAKNWHKVYDAMTALNKKITSLFNIKLFIIQDKTFKINPIFASKILQEKS